MAVTRIALSLLLLSALPAEAGCERTCPSEWTNLGRMARYHDILQGHRHQARHETHQPSNIIHLRYCLVPVTDVYGTVHWVKQLGGVPGSRWCMVYP